MALDNGDQPVVQATDLSNTSILGVKDGVQTVRVSIDSLTSTILDLDGGSASVLSSDITIDLDGGGA